MPMAMAPPAYGTSTHCWSGPKIMTSETSTMNITPVLDGFVASPLEGFADAGHFVGCYHGPTHAFLHLMTSIRATVAPACPV